MVKGSKHSTKLSNPQLEQEQCSTPQWVDK